MQYMELMMAKKREFLMEVKSNLEGISEGFSEGRNDGNVDGITEGKDCLLSFDVDRISF